MQREVILRVKLVDAVRERSDEVLVKAFSRRTVASAEHGEFVEAVLVGADVYHLRQPRVGGEEVGYLFPVVGFDDVDGLVEAFGEDSGGEEEGVYDFGDAGGVH